MLDSFATTAGAGAAVAEREDSKEETGDGAEALAEKKVELKLLEDILVCFLVVDWWCEVVK